MYNVHVSVCTLIRTYIVKLTSILMSTSASSLSDCIARPAQVEVKAKNVDTRSLVKVSRRQLETRYFNSDVVYQSQLIS